MCRKWLGMACLLVVTTTISAQKRYVAPFRVTDDSTIVKIGYADGNNKTMSGSVDQITEEHMNKGLMTNPLDALSGKAAGVSISSQEAMISAVRVRGTTSLTGGNDPLVIIDGVSSDLATLSTVYPADIESFTILKDASETAQYGSRGASGVIQVATKKGRNEQFHISYDGNIGWESIYKNIEMLSGSEFRSAASALGVTIIDKGYDSDFLHTITRGGFVQNDHLAVDLGVFGSLQKNNYIPFTQKLFYSAAAFNPTYSTGLNSDGGWDQIPDASQINNPSSLLTMKDDEDNGHFNVHLRMNADLGHGLSVAAFGSYSYNVVDLSQYFPTIVWSHGQAYRGEDKSEELLGDMTVSYNHDWNKHHLDVLGLAEVQVQTRKGFYTTVSSFSTDEFGYDNLAAGAVRAWDGTGSYFENPHMESFLARANYVYDNRYTLTVNARTDASSKVGKNNRWGFFPSVSGAWMISNEKFM